MRSNMKKNKLISILVIITVFVIILFFFLAEYNVAYRRTEVLSSSSGEYNISIYMIGEPQFPYGYTKWGFSLYSRRRKIREESHSLLNDGKIVTAENFIVIWDDDAVEIVASGLEEDDVRFVMLLESHGE